MVVITSLPASQNIPIVMESTDSGQKSNSNLAENNRPAQVIMGAMPSSSSAPPPSPVDEHEVSLDEQRADSEPEDQRTMGSEDISDIDLDSQGSSGIVEPPSGYMLDESNLEDFSGISEALQENPDLKSVDPRTQARLEALLEAAGVGKLSTADGQAFADPEVLRKLTSSVSCALDEAAAALTRMRAEQQVSATPAPANERTLAEACSDGDIVAVKRLLSEGRSVHETTEEGESLLSLACSAGYYELAEVLLRMRANVEDRGIKGDCTPLMEAASGGFDDVVRLLIAYDADVNAQSSAGHTPLHHAAVGGFEDVVKALLTAGANVEEQNENGHTPLMEAASAGHVTVAKILLDAGAGINTHSNEFKESALTLACYKGHLDMVKFLLDAGADQEHKTDEMHTALMEASMDGHVKVAKLLLDSGAQVNMPADSFESPLTLAACGGHVELANLLIERGANLEEVNDEGYTPLMEAAREGHEEMVALLIAHGADVNVQTEETQETALTLACCGGFLEVAHFLIRANANIELGCSTPLMEAAQEGHLDLVKYLIKQGANVHSVTGTGDSALTYASENGHTDVADVLLQAGAELEHESEGGRTPLMKAARAGHLCTVQFLLTKCADVNRSTTNNDHTVLSLACAGGHLGVVELLLQNGADPMHKLKDGSTMLIEAAKGGHTNVVNLLLDYPHTLAKTSTASSDYQDTIPMADNMPADPTMPKDVRTTEGLASRLEQFIQKMMSQAENLSGTREEQMARKQEILEELQRVEQELKSRTQSSLEGPSVLPAAADGTSTGDTDAELQQKEQALLDQQRHEQQLQQQKEYYQTKLQLLKQQYQQKQLQLQQQRQQLLSQAVNNSVTSEQNGSGNESSDETSRHQPIPLHIALQNHLHAHHVTEGNVNDLAQALQDWDTRDRSIAMSSQIKPMPAFNLNGRHEEEPEPPSLPLRLDELPFTEAPPSRSLADALATLIQSQDHKPTSSTLDLTLGEQAIHKPSSTGFDPSLEQAIENTSSLRRPVAEYTSTLNDQKTREWLQQMDAGCAEPKKDIVTLAKLEGEEMLENVKVPPSKPVALKAVLPNGLVDTTRPTTSVMQQTDGISVPLPSPQRSQSPPGSYVDPNAATDTNHDTALTLACAGGHAELVKLLLSRHAEIEHRDKKGFTPLILASTAGHAEVVEILMENSADIEAQSERTKDTPLSLACSGGRYEVVEILLRLGANKEHRNVSDYTPLSLAASGGYVNIIKLLLSYGAEINSRTGSKLGISPLMLAAMNGHTAAVKLLLDMGSDINAQIETNRNTALTLACFQGRHDVVSLLVDRKANIEHRAKTGLTPLMEAASGGYVEVGRVLLDKGADVNAPSVPSSKDTALTIAADKGHFRFVELLLSRGAAVDVKNKKGNSPLWLACNGGHLEVVQLLVSSGADIDSQDNRRVSCMMTSFRKGHVKVVKWLVRHVTQFPSDPECVRYIATITDKEMLKKCQQCMEVIVQAKDCQAEEAAKNASILLSELESEKFEEDKRKEAAARKREKKKKYHRKKTPANEQSKFDYDEDDEKESSPSVEENKPEERTPVAEVEAPKKLTVASANNSNKKASNNDHKRLAPLPTANAVNEEMANPSNHIEEESNITNVKNRRNKKKSSAQLREQREQNRANHDSMDENHRNRVKTANPSTTRVAELDDFGDVTVVTNGNNRHNKGKKNYPVSSNINQLDTFDNPPSKYISPAKTAGLKGITVTATPSPSKKKKGEEGWKEVIRKSKRLSIPLSAVSKLNGKLAAIKEVSGAHIEIEKPDRKSTERNILIKGSTEATRQASNLIAVLLRETDKEFDSLINKKLSETSTAAAVSAPVTTVEEDTMSSIGTFNLADFIVSSAQTTVPAETKAKVVQSKPGWPVRPQTQSAWGINSTSVTSTVAPPAPVMSSPRYQAPVRQQLAATPKHPSIVSRKLFPADQSVTATSAASSSAQSVPSAASPAARRSLSHQPRSSQPLAAVASAGQPPTPAQQRVNQQVPVVVMSQANPDVRYTVGTSAVTRPPHRPVAPAITSYTSAQHAKFSPFDIGHPSMEEFDKRRPDPSKAPGFRPQPSPQSLPSMGYPLSMPGEVPYNAQAGIRLPGQSEENMGLPPYASLSVNTSVHSLFASATSPQDVTSMVSSSRVLEGEYSPRSAILRDQYTTRNQPMTLPKISSSLNPNASEFTCSSRLMGDEGAQQSPRSGKDNSPADYSSSSSVSMYQQKQPKTMADPDLLLHQMQMFSSSSQQPSVSQLISSQSGTSGQVPLHMPRRTYSPANQQIANAAADGMQMKGDGSVESPRTSPRDSLEDRRTPRPIGGERYRKELRGFPQGPPGGAAQSDPADIWSTKAAEGDWPVNSMPSGIGDVAMHNSVFKVDGTALPPMPPYPYYPGFQAGAGDGLANTWHNSPGKMAAQDWSGWNQPNSNG